MRLPTIADHFIAEYNVRKSELSPINPSDDRPPYGTYPRNRTERVIKHVYEDLGFQVGEVDNKRNRPMDHATRKMEHTPKDHLSKLLLASDDPPNRPFDLIERDGIPDFFMWHPSHGIQFVEVKTLDDSIRESQRNWITEFDYLPVKIVFATTEKDRWRQFLSTDPSTLI